MSEAVPASAEPGALVVSTTLPTRAGAEDLARTVVAERLAACGQVSGPLASHYEWNGTLERAEEWAIQFKTTRARWPALRDRIRQLHPYDVPEIIATDIVAGHESYLQWVREMTRDRAPGV